MASVPTGWTLGQRLLLINGCLFALMAAVAVSVWAMMGRLGTDAELLRTSKNVFTIS